MTRGLSVCSAHRLWLLRQPRFHIARSDHPIHDRLDEGLTWPAEARVRQVVAQESCPCVQTHQSIAHPGRCRVRGLLAAAVHMMRHCQAQILLVVVLRQPLRERTSATAAAPLQQARGMQQYETCAQALRMSKQSRADSILSMQRSRACACVLDVKLNGGNAHQPHLRSGHQWQRIVLSIGSLRCRPASPRLLDPTHALQDTTFANPSKHAQ